MLTEADPMELRTIISLLDDACPFCQRTGRCSFEKPTAFNDFEKRGSDCMFFELNKEEYDFNRS